MTTACWASVLGGCAGGITGEHVLSKSLLGDSVNVRGLPWCRDEFVTIGTAAFTSKSLCKAHNNALSECDQEAQRLNGLMNWMMSDFFHPDGPDRVETLNGHLVARWLCKTACNIAAVGNRPPPMPFVRYAFSEVDDPSVHVFTARQETDRITLNSSHYRVQWLQHDTNPNSAYVAFGFRGMTWIIATQHIDLAKERINALVQGLGITPWAYVARVQGMEVIKVVPGLGPCLAGRLLVRW